MTNNSDIEVKYTSYENGCIRDTLGKLVAHWDKFDKDLVIDGVREIHSALDIEHAMDLVNEHYQVA